MRLQHPRVFQARKAISGIVAALILFTMMFTIGSGYFLWVNTNNLVYSHALVDRNDLNQNQESESVTITPACCTSGHLTFIAKNTGGSPVLLTADTVDNPSSGTVFYNTIATGVTVNPGSSSSSVDTGFAYTSGTVLVKALTQRGNIFSEFYPVPTVPVANLSFASNGLGFLALDFNSYKWYKYVSCMGGSNVGGTIDTGSSPGLSNPSHVCFLSPTKVNSAPLAYTISAAGWPGGANEVFSANVTNVDPQKRTMVLDAWSQMWFAQFNLGPGGGRANSFAFGLINMSSYSLNSKVYPWCPTLNTCWVPATPLTTSTNTPHFTLKPGQSVTLFFAINNGGDPRNSFSVTPIFVLFHGTLGGQSWAQDFPIATTIWN